MITVLIIDDQELIRLGPHSLTGDGSSCVDEATNGRATTAPRLADTKVIVLTTFEHDELSPDAPRCGASGFLLNESKSADLVHAIRSAVRSGTLTSPSVNHKVILDLAAASYRPMQPHPHLHTLTGREREIVVLAAAGLGNDKIAKQLIISPATVRTHISRAMLKLGARDRAQLVVFAYQSGLAGQPQSLEL